MKTIRIILLGLAFALCSFAVSQYTWEPDPNHAIVSFTVKHLGINFIHGKFDTFDGTMTYSKDDLTDASINFTVAASSVNTFVSIRDNNLRSARFLDVATYPQMKFESTKIEKAEGADYLLYGNLTIKDVTKPVVFRMVYGGKSKDLQGNDKLGFSASTQINRFDYHVNYDGTDVATDIEIRVDLELKRKA